MFFLVLSVLTRFPCIASPHCPSSLTVSRWNCYQVPDASHAYPPFTSFIVLVDVSLDDAPLQILFNSHVHAVLSAVVSSLHIQPMYASLLAGDSHTLPVHCSNTFFCLPRVSVARSLFRRFCLRSFFESVLLVVTLTPNYRNPLSPRHHRLIPKTERTPTSRLKQFEA